MKKISAGFLLLCILNVLPVKAQYGSSDSAKTVAPFKLFDNLYYVGNEFVSAYVLQTDKGLILIDALYGKFITDIPVAFTQLGLDIKQVKYILCTHAHYDHSEGALYLKKLTGAKILMTGPDWQIADGTVQAPYASVNTIIPKEKAVRDGDSLKLGNTTLYFYETPGHTPGVLSIAFPVKENGRSYQAFMFGGVGLNFDGVERTEMYLRSVRRIQQMTNIEVNISNHPGPGKIFERMKQRAGLNPGEPDPFIAPADFQEWLKGLEKAGEQKLAEEKKKAGRDVYNNLIKKNN